MMKKLLLLLLACLASSYLNAADNILMETSQRYPYTPINRMAEIKKLLAEPSAGIQQDVQNKVLTTIKCINEFKVGHNNILAVIDYSLPSNQKRLWVFDLIDNKLLFHTYVSHGINSGSVLTNYFSNKNNSKASSLGVYNTEKSYYGRHGLSLQLSGLDRGFNDNASRRAVVMHGGWYVEEEFIKKYGRPGRSWGCPAVPDTLSTPIIDVLKEKAILVIFYPFENWIYKSKYLNCDSLRRNYESAKSYEMPMPSEEKRESILFADINKNNSREENEPIVVITANHYREVFNNKPPLTRMLRRQINHAEYIALSEQEFKGMDSQDRLDNVYFVIPVVKFRRGYYETDMEFYPLGKIREVQLNANSSDSNKDHIVFFESKPMVSLKLDSKFIRWLGL